MRRSSIMKKNLREEELKEEVKQPVRRERKLPIEFGVSPAIDLKPKAHTENVLVSILAKYFLQKLSIKLAPHAVFQKCMHVLQAARINL